MSTKRLPAYMVNDAYTPEQRERAERARERARHSWDDWDQEEIDREFDPWPELEGTVDVGELTRASSDFWRRHRGEAR